MITSKAIPQAGSDTESSMAKPVLVAGAGMAGLAASITLAARGVPVVLVDSVDLPGGKLRQKQTPIGPVDVGPTVLTLKWVFDSLLQRAGTCLDQELSLEPLDVLAHHRWPDGSRLDLFADPEQTEHSIAALCGREEAIRWRRFSQDAERLNQALTRSFLLRSPPSMLGMLAAMSPKQWLGLLAIRPMQSLWRRLGHYFHDPRLQQLYGRYATYCGSSPFQAPATLAMIAAVEQQGVWRVEGGLLQLALLLERTARRSGARICLGHAVTTIHRRQGQIDAVELSNGQVEHVSGLIWCGGGSSLQQLLHPQDAPDSAHRQGTRSLSAVTWAGSAQRIEAAIAHHTVIFSQDYVEEFRDLEQRGRAPGEPTVYICAADRTAPQQPGNEMERLFLLVNAPPSGDQPGAWRGQAVARLAESVERGLERCGLRVNLAADSLSCTTPADFEGRFPGTGGALYGAAMQGWRAAFRRPGARTALPGLYQAGADCHPGAGLPMAALSGVTAAEAAWDDLQQHARARLPALRRSRSHAPVP